MTVKFDDLLVTFQGINVFVSYYNFLFMIGLSGLKVTNRIDMIVAREIAHKSFCKLHVFLLI